MPVVAMDRAGHHCRVRFDVLCSTGCEAKAVGAPTAGSTAMCAASGQSVAAQAAGSFALAGIGAVSQATSLSCSDFGDNA
jgi:hypothetical protein